MVVIELFNELFTCNYNLLIISKSYYPPLLKLLFDQSAVSSIFWHNAWDPSSSISRLKWKMVDARRSPYKSELLESCIEWK